MKPELTRPVDRIIARERREGLREILTSIPEILDKNPDQWFSLFVRRITQVDQNLTALPPETQEYLRPIIDHSRRLLKNESRFYHQNPSDPIFEPLNNSPDTAGNQNDWAKWRQSLDDLRGVRADELIMEISRLMATPFEQDLVPVEELVVPIVDIVNRHPGVTDLTTKKHGRYRIPVFHAKDPYSDYWQEILLPFDNTIALKGGSARLINNLHSDSPLSMISAEIPLNDTDVVAVGDQASARKKATILGADPSGVEMKRGKLDYLDYANSRDMTINMAYVAADGLHTCPQTILAARSGITEISGNYRAEKAIYNTDRFSWFDSQTGNRETVAKQRGLSREVKATAEGKIIGFSYKDLNANTPLGIYALWLVRRWVKYLDKPELPTEKFGELLQKMYFIAENMGHVPQGCQNVMEYLEVTHQDSPHFDFNKDMVSIVDHVRWLGGKRLPKQIDREYGWATGVPSEYAFTRRPNDTVSRTITLDGFKLDDRLSTQIVEWYPGFIRRCQDRTAHYHSLNISPVKLLFYDLDTEDPTSAEI